MNDRNHTILYLMRHIDIAGHVDIPYKKIGITGKGSADLTTRLRQLSNTKSPIQVLCIKAWEFENAAEVEDALHAVLKNDRVEGEWFYDKEDDLVDRILPIVSLLKGKPISIEGEEDLYTQTVLKKEEQKKNVDAERVLGELAGKIRHSLRSSIRVSGPTFFSDKTELTYYVSIRKSGLHNLDFGRSKDKFEELIAFLSDNNYEAEKHDRGYAMMLGLTTDIIAEVINSIEDRFSINNTIEALK